MPPTDPTLSIPWRRLLTLLRPLRRSLARMVSLSVSGSLIGLVPPIALGFLVNSLAAGGHRSDAALWAALIIAALIAESVAYAISDGLYAGVSGRLYRDLRMLMFDGAVRRSQAAPEEASGLMSRFVSDVETVENITVAALDLGTMRTVEFVAAVVALGFFDPWAVLLVTALIVATIFLVRLMQSPVAVAGRGRQEELEGMSRTLARELAGRSDLDRSRGRFRASAERVLSSEIRLGWLEALNTHGSGMLAALGPIAVVIAAAFEGSYKAGTLLSLYLLAERAFQGADSLVDLSLDAQIVRGAAARCFELIDARAGDEQ